MVPVQPVAARTPPPPAWPTLPAMQRVVGEQPTVAGLDTFGATLSTHRDPRFLGPLGHHVVATAPSGVVTGLATVVQRSFRGRAERAGVNLQEAVPAAEKSHEGSSQPVLQHSAASASVPQSPQAPPPTSRAPAGASPPPPGALEEPESTGEPTETPSTDHVPTETPSIDHAPVELDVLATGHATLSPAVAPLGPLLRDDPGDPPPPVVGHAPAPTSPRANPTVVQRSVSGPPTALTLAPTPALSGIPPGEGPPAATAVAGAEMPAALRQVTDDEVSPGQLGGVLPPTMVRQVPALDWSESWPAVIHEAPAEATPSAPATGLVSETSGLPRPVPGSDLTTEGLHRELPEPSPVSPSIQRTADVVAAAPPADPTGAPPGRTTGAQPGGAPTPESTSTPTIGEPPGPTGIGLASADHRSDGPSYARETVPGEAVVPRAGLQPRFEVDVPTSSLRASAPLQRTTASLMEGGSAARTTAPKGGSVASPTLLWPPVPAADASQVRLLPTSALSPQSLKPWFADTGTARDQTSSPAVSASTPMAERPPVQRAAEVAHHEGGWTGVPALYRAALPEPAPVLRVVASEPTPVPTFPRRMESSAGQEIVQRVRAGEPPARRSEVPGTEGPRAENPGRQQPPDQPAPGTVPVADHPGFTEVAVQRAVDDPGSTVATAPQGTVGADLQGTASEQPLAAAAAPTASGAGVAGAGDPAGVPNLDELARRLYEPLSARLRAELWLDRERTGRSLM